MKHVAHWDDVEPYRPETRHLAGDWYDLGRGAGSFDVGLKRIMVDPGKWSTPAHSEGAEEEIFFVLEGAGTVLLGEESAAVRRGSIVSRPAGPRIAHSFRAGEDALVYLAYGTRESNDVVYYPRTEEIRFRGVGVTLPAGKH